MFLEIYTFQILNIIKKNNIMILPNFQNHQNYFFKISKSIKNHFLNGELQ